MKAEIVTYEFVTISLSSKHLFKLLCGIIVSYTVTPSKCMCMGMHVLECL